jgi:uncharacterized hydrophobic protein (TIGR00271 family)
MSVTVADVDRMADALFIEGPWRSKSSSKFWILLGLAAIIATAGVIADSTATVIGAMIVAPLMTPILGTALAVVLADHRHLVRSVGLVIGGALAVIAIAFVFGLIAAPPDAFASNSQVDARISPGLIDLVAALATGTVGAFALVRSDISDTLPGVAIAISLVPPLAVVGLLLSVQRYADASGALLLFGTNVAAIIATGTVVLLLYKVRPAAASGDYEPGQLRGRTLVTVVALLFIVTIPLAIGTASVTFDQLLAAKARPVAQEWARGQGWEVAEVSVRDGGIVVVALGPLPNPDITVLRKDLNDNGMVSSDLSVELVAGGTALCPANGEVCKAAT